MTPPDRSSARPDPREAGSADTEAIRERFAKPCMMCVGQGRPCEWCAAVNALLREVDRLRPAAGPPHTYAAGRAEVIAEIRAAIPGSFWGRGSKWPDGTDPYFEGGQCALNCVQSILDRLDAMPDAERIATTMEPVSARPAAGPGGDEALKRGDAMREALEKLREPCTPGDRADARLILDRALRARAPGAGSALDALRKIANEGFDYGTEMPWQTREARAALAASGAPADPLESYEPPNLEQIADDIKEKYGRA